MVSQRQLEVLMHGTNTGILIPILIVHGCALVILVKLLNKMLKMVALFGKDWIEVWAQTIGS